MGWSVSTGTVWDRQGFGGSWIFSEDGRYLTIACFGYRSQKPRETLPAELVRLDLETGRVVRRLEAERPIVVSEESVAAVDLVALRELGGGHVEGAGISWLSSGGGNKGAMELSITSDGRRGYVLYGGSSKVVACDLEENEVLAELTTGRGGVKFAKFLGAGGRHGGLLLRRRFRGLGDGLSLLHLQHLRGGRREYDDRVRPGREVRLRSQHP